jgi:hypothetical protein
MCTRMGALCAALLVAGSATTASRADERARAEALFDQARADMRAGDFDRACPGFRESFAVYASIGAALNLGRCEELLGRTASAAAAYRRAEALAREAGDDERARAAGAFARRLEAGLSTLRIELPAAGLTVRVDREPLGADAVGVARPIDPGLHRIEVESPDGRRWSIDTTVGTEADDRVVTVPPVEAWPSPSDGEAAAEDDGLPPLTVAGIVVSAAGGAGLVVGAVFGGLALREEGRAAQACPDARCPGPDSPGREHVESARTSALVADVALAVGGTLAGLGLIGIIAGSLQADDEPAVDATLGPDRFGVTVRGRF